MYNRGLEFSFAWLFSIIVGAAIIFLAVFAVTNLVSTERRVQDTEAGQSVGVLLSPVETDLESGKVAKISFPSETRLLNECGEPERGGTAGIFGRQNIKISSSSGVGEEYGFPGEPSSFFNKYVFSSGTVQGEEMVVWAKPFSYPYKVADLLLIWGVNDEYCFVNPPGAVERDIKELEFEVVSDVGGCSAGSKKVCFNLGVRECDIEISLNNKRVSKDGQTLRYSDEFDNALLYGAIFADPGIYECQVRRLMKRVFELSELYLDKTEYLTPRGCSSNLEVGLKTYGNTVLLVEGSFDLGKSESSASEIGRRNELLSCKLW